MDQLRIVQGAYADYPIQSWNRGKVTQPAYASGDTLAAYVYQGQSDTVLFAPSVTWYTAGSTQTGYTQGQVLVSITGAQSALLEQNGTYTLQVWWTQSGGGKTEPIVRSQLVCEPAAGATIQTVTPYCQLSDLLDYAPWVSIVQNTDSDQEGFYRQRLKAREWMDWMILNDYRGAFVGLFETHSTAAFEFGYAGWRRSLGPSPSLITYLSQNMLLVKPYIVEACAYKAISLVGLGQIGLNNQLASHGAYYRDMATRKACEITAEVDINGDGIGELFISLNSTNSLYT
jgi:hypothetical protein